MRLQVRIFIVSVILAAYSSYACASEAEDRCRDVLELAAHNIDQSLHMSNMKSDIRNKLCTQQATDIGNNAARGGGLTIFGYGSGNAHDDQSQYQRVKNESCSAGSSDLSQDNYDSILKNSVYPEAVEAWKACMANEGKGLRGLVEQNGDTLIFTVWWDAIMGVQSVKVESSQAIGVSGCDQWPQQGTELNSHKLIKACSKVKNSDVTFIVQTSNDALRIIIPAKIVGPAVPPPPKSNRQKCLEGDNDACLAIRNEISTQCNQGDMTCLIIARSYQNLLSTIQVASFICSSNDPQSKAQCKQNRLVMEDSRTSLANALGANR